MIREIMHAGLVDHMHIVVVPILLGRRVRVGRFLCRGALCFASEQQGVVSVHRSARAIGARFESPSKRD